MRRPRYWEEVAGPPVASFVARFSRSLDLEPPPAPVRVLPDGGVDLLFSFAPDGGIRAAEVFGAKSRALRVHDREALEKLAVHLRPGALARLFRIPAWELRDASARLEDLWSGGAALRERLAEAPGWSARRRLLESALREMPGYGDGSPAPGVVDGALARVLERRGAVPVGALARDLGVSARSLERAFREHVGLPPKLFARIVRLQAARRELARGRSGAETAARSGYSDQAHMVREMRALAGVPPGGL